MRNAIVHFSLTGNNATLAARLARETGWPAVPVVEARRRRFGFFTLLRDISRHRRPPIRPLGLDPAGLDAALFFGPLYDMQIAHPLASAVQEFRHASCRYAFATLCGYSRAGQEAHVRAELSELAGRPPERVWELRVGDLMRAAERRKVRVVSRYRVTPDELDRFAAPIAETAAWCETAAAGERS